MALFNFNGLPGIDNTTETVENMFLWGKHEQAMFRSILLSSTSTDLGHAPNTTLRNGLVLAQVANVWYPYKSNATDGTQVASGVLASDVKMLNIDGTTGNKVAVAVVAGPVKGSCLFYNAPVQSATTLSDADQQIRAQLAGNMIFDDQLPQVKYPWLSWTKKTADYSVLIPDNGTVFTNTGATGVVKFTLPPLLDANSNPVCKGCNYKFVVEADQDVWVQGAGSDVIITFNSITSVVIKIDQTSKRYGTTIEIETSQDGTKWIATLNSNLWANVTVA